MEYRCDWETVSKVCSYRKWRESISKLYIGVLISSQWDPSYMFLQRVCKTAILTSAWKVSVTFELSTSAPDTAFISERTFGFASTNQTRCFAIRIVMKRNFCNIQLCTLLVYTTKNVMGILTRQRTEVGNVIILPLLLLVAREVPCFSSIVLDFNSILVRFNNHFGNK